LKLDNPINLSQEFKDILDHLENNNSNFLITGRAGTGKSTLLNLFKRTSKKKIVTVAPTGIAALNVGGQTIHSLFGLPPRMVNLNELTKRKNHRFFKKIQTVIIDEISMVRADLFDAIDRLMRVNREIDLPFGGAQIVLFGDLFQLPPVVASTYEKQLLATMYKSPYFFSSRAYHASNFEIHELHTVYRQEERGFIQLLESIRKATMDMDELMEINERSGLEPEEGDTFITLCSTNAIANTINKERMEQILEPAEFYAGKVTGVFKENLYPTALTLKLKVGAQIMFLKNDPQRRFANGTLGIIVETAYDHIMVNIEDSHLEESLIKVEAMDWEVLKYKINEENPKKFETEVVGVFTQIPVKPAWAMTIHKSQGKTFDRIVIDLGRGAFDFGQTYVALSRCRTLDGIFLKKPLTPKDVMIDPRIMAFYDYHRMFL